MSTHVNRKEYFIVFAVLAALTALKNRAVYAGMGRHLLILALVGLAVSKLLS